MPLGHREKTSLNMAKYMWVKGQYLPTWLSK